MPTVTVADTTVHYVASGTGPALVLVAGTGLPAQVNFGHLVGEFADRRTVVLPDYAGSGETTDPGGPLTLDLLTEQIAAAAAATSDEPVDLLGFSLGAVVAAAVAATRPELVRRLVLVAGWPGPDDARHELEIDLWARLADGDIDLFNRFLQLNCFSPSFLSTIGFEGVRQLVEGAPPVTPGMRRHIELDRHADVRSLLPKITAPTLVIGLTQDQVVPPARARQVHEAIPGSEYAEIDSGHVVVFERPQELVAEVRRFLLG